MRPVADAPQDVDVHVGGRLRSIRKSRRVSQQALAAELGLTFQQVQKYERGSNRISASRLYEAALTLQVPVHTFFEGLPDPSSGTEPQALTADRNVLAFLQTPEGFVLASLWPRIKPPLRRQLLALVSEIAAEE